MPVQTLAGLGQQQQQQQHQQAASEAGLSVRGARRGQQRAAAELSGGTGAGEIQLTFKQGELPLFFKRQKKFRWFVVLMSYQFDLII